MEAGRPAGRQSGQVKGCLDSGLTLCSFGDTLNGPGGWFFIF